MYGYNDLFSFNDASTDTTSFVGWTYNQTPIPPYCFLAYVVNSAGIMCQANGDGPGPNYIQPVNLVNIMGSVDIDPVVRRESAGLADLIRLISVGMRVMPQNELLTVSDTPGMTAIYGANVVLNNVLNNMYIGPSPQAIDTYITGIEPKRFSNNEGCCARLNPFQPEFTKFHNYSDLMGSYSGDTTGTTSELAQTYNYGNNAVPLIYLKFNQAIAATSNDGTTWQFNLPFYFEARVFLEIVPSIPTPLIGQPSPIDPNWTTINEVMQAAPDSLCPYITEGNSFESFYTGANKFLTFANKFLQFGTTVLSASKVFA